MLYDGIRGVIRKHLTDSVAPAVAAVPEEHILPALQEQWTRHLLTSRMIADILMYLVSKASKSMLHQCCRSVAKLLAVPTQALKPPVAS